MIPITRSMVENTRAKIAKAKEGQGQWSRETFTQLLKDCTDILGEDGVIAMNWGFYLGEERKVSVQLHREDDKITVTTDGIQLTATKETENLLQDRILLELAKLI